MPFLGDEGRDALIARQIITGQNFPLIGPPTSVGKLFLGPLFFYLIAPFLALFRFNPLGPAVFMGFLSTATVVLIYLLVQEVFKSKSAAFFSALLYALTPQSVIFGRWPWNPNIMPFFTTLLIYSLWQALENKKEVFILISGLSLAFILQSHYLGLAALPLTVLAVFYKRQNITNKKYYLYALLIFIFLMSPLFIFDLKYDFLNLKGFIEIITSQKNGSGSAWWGIITRAKDKFRQVFGLFIGFEERSLVNNLAILVAFIAWWRLETQKKRWWLILIWLITGTFFLGIYQGPFYPHYLQFILVVPAIIFGVLLDILSQKKLLKPLVFLVLSYFTLSFSYQSFQKIRQTVIPNVNTGKEIADFIKQQSHDKEFNFALLAKNNYDASYRYFFELNQAKLKNDEAADQLFVVCEGQEVCQPQGNSKWEIALFEVKYDGQVQVKDQWQFYNYFYLYLITPI
jgi:4-amino-4-deoxy-L-arabinose transferase-like glycosyltransferase